MKYKAATILRVTLGLSSLASLSGCLGLGSNSYSCPGLEEGVICMSTRDVYEATENSNSVKVTDTGKKSKHVDSQDEVPAIDHRQYSTGELKANLEYYRKKATDDPTKENVKALLQLQDLVDKREALANSVMADDSAPEAQAMRSNSSNMRIWVAPWKDDVGDLNLSGYVYTEVVKRQWLIGKEAVEEPSRIVPLQVVRRKEENSEKSAQKPNYRSTDLKPLN